MRSARRYAAVAALVPFMMLAACAGSDVTKPQEGQATLIVTANLTTTPAVMIVVEVTAPDITTPLVFNIPVTNGVASGPVTLPAGSNRTITIHAFDAGGVETNRGSVTINVVAGTNPTVSLVLTPLTGDVPIAATIGSIAVSVSPTSPVHVEVGGTVTLTATVTGTTGTVNWATDNPGVATVVAGGSNTAVVTGVGAGTTTIVATLQGVAGAATVTVP